MDYAKYDEILSRLNDLMEFVPTYNEGGEKAAKVWQTLKYARDALQAQQEANA